MKLIIDTNSRYMAINTACIFSDILLRNFNKCGGFITWTEPYNYENAIPKLSLWQKN